MYILYIVPYLESLHCPLFDFWFLLYSFDQVINVYFSVIILS